MALLDGANAWAHGMGIALHVVTVDHGLRAGAAAEAALVSDACAARDVPHDVLRLKMEDGPGLQARARAARYDAIRGWAEGRVGPVLLGHTADDVAETLLMRLQRGVGLDGLARMPDWWTDASGQEWARPLLRLSREDLRGHLRAKGIAWAEDPSNDDPRFERVRVRRQMAVLGLSAPKLARSAEALADAAQSIDERTHALARDVVRQDGPDLVIGGPAFEFARFQEQEQVRRLFAASIAWIGGARPRGAEMDRLTRSCDASEKARWTLGGCLILRTGGGGDPRPMRWRVTRELAACGPPVPWDETWDGRWTLSPPRGARGPFRQAGHLVSALGDDLPAGRRCGGLPRESLRSSPAVRDRDGRLVAAPFAALGADWTARPARPFHDTLRPRRPMFR